MVSMHRHDNNVVYIFVFNFNIIMIRNKIY